MTRLLLAVAVTLCVFAVTVRAESTDDANRVRDRARQRSAEVDFQTLTALQDAFRAVSAKLRPSLVRIETVGGAQPHGVLSTSTPDASDSERPPAFRETLGSRFVIADGPTTGIVYSADGYIITSSFNFVRSPVLISVVLHDGRRFAANLIARDRVRKVALLKIDATGLTVPQWADPADVRVGQWAIALGLDGIGRKRI